MHGAVRQRLPLNWGQPGDAPPGLHGCAQYPRRRVIAQSAKE